MSRYSFGQKHILITGATGGLGSAIARRLAVAGAHLVVTSRSEDALAELLTYFPDGTQAVSIAADLSREGQPGKVVEEALDALGHIDVLFNIAGVGYFAPMEDVAADKLRYLFEVNTFSPLAFIQRLLPHMKKRHSGRIINIVSCAGRIPIPTEGVYGGSKSALAVMTNTLRLEVAPLGIDVINIYPGTVATDFERNALREHERPGVCPRKICGRPLFDVADKILTAARGPAGEAWLDREAKWMATAAVVWPRHVDRRLEALRARLLKPSSEAEQPWRLWQVESSIACNLRCIMCPWKQIRQEAGDRGIMDEGVWAALRPYLPSTRAIDFTGGGEPLLQPRLDDWLSEAKAAGCETGFLSNGLLLDPERGKRIMDTGLDWICFSVDGTTAAVYEEIRLGSDFQRVCDNIAGFSSLRPGIAPRIMINFVMMPANVHQLEDIVRLAAKLGVDQVNFKQCDVVRGEHGSGFALFAGTRTKEVRKMEKALGRARRLARKFKICATAFSFSPKEQSVCDQDPRNSLFVRYDGSVAPCINLAIGGPSTFLGKPVTMPTVHYGRLPDADLNDLWKTDTCRFYRELFEARVDAHDRQLARSDLNEASLPKLNEALQAAIDAMPDPPEGCSVCHYLYGI